RLENLGDELELVNVQAALRDALETVGADLGHPRVVVRPSAPQGLQALPHSRDAGPRLSGVDRRADAECRRFDPLRRCDLPQMEPVRWRAHERRGAELPYCVQSVRRVLAAAGNRHRAEDPGALEPGPKADEEAERERKVEAVPRPESGAAEHEGPAARPPGP